ncbi:cell morphogenesis N-terminal-domain-containing protein [Flammula alnicola]|nr:cell morphogenesis N-terminal-domain-containing protein [Flammula alnicola]
MPSLEHSPYPVLKNPFNRSTSSLTHIAPPMSRTMSSTPTSAIRTCSTVNEIQRSRFSKSQHSHSGSIFHISDGGSDSGNFYLPSPPPVPRVPRFEDDKVVMDPKTPSDYALHAVLYALPRLRKKRWKTSSVNPGPETLLTTFMGPGVDPKFDETLHSLGIIAQKHAKKVIDSVMRWRRSQSETIGSDIINSHMAQAPGPNRKDVPGLLNEPPLERCTWRRSRLQLRGDHLEQFRKPDRKSLALSPNHRINSELYATLLGHLANGIRSSRLGQVSKDAGTRYENLVKGLKHIKIKVWPPEAFEEGAEFMESLSKSYGNAHGQLKIAFAETLIMLLHPIGKTAQAETNNPQWGKAIEIIYPRAREMSKRYWQVAFPLAITALCVAPQAYFLKHWQPFFENSISKLKTISLGRVEWTYATCWTYLYRCQEAASTTMTKLEAVLKNFFPSNRTTVFPSDEHPEPLVYIMHFILSRHPDYGRELCLELMQETTINNLQKTGSIGSVLAHERTMIAINAVLLSVHNTEREILTPTWPSSSNFSVVPAKDDYPSSSAYICQLS